MLTPECHWRQYHTRELAQIELFADGIPLIDYSIRNVYLLRLQRALEEDGEYEIFCCSCGTAHCGALPDAFVLIRHEGDRLHWTHTGDLPKARYTFVTEQVRAEVARLEKELYAWFAATPDLQEPRSQEVLMSPEEVYLDWKRRTLHL
ncbi:hypothetical protein BUE76_01385 [Cnuella takakiae]|nr:hypothetical protein BUE76_01385 [Cnuella takakiae]